MSPTLSYLEIIRAKQHGDRLCGTVQPLYDEAVSRVERLAHKIPKDVERSDSPIARVHDELANLLSLVHGEAAMGRRNRALHYIDTGLNKIMRDEEQLPIELRCAPLLAKMRVELLNVQESLPAKASQAL